MRANNLYESVKTDLSKNLRTFYLCILMFHALRHNKKILRYKFMRLALDSHNLHKQNSHIKMSLYGMINFHVENIS